jgi:hypothetical protein
MILSLMMFALTVVVAFFHYIQGFFSATISAILVVIAAVVAVAYHEQLAPLLFSAKFYEQAESISLVVLFAAAYIIPRLLFDWAVPGNVRLPVLVDKIGAGAAGVVAGLLSVGVLAIAAQALPFGPSIGMYSRFSVIDKTGITYPGLSGQNQDTENHEVLVGETIDADAAEKNHLWLWQDDLVNSLVKKVTGASGSLAGNQPFDSIHPDWIDELFGQRLGIQVGGNHALVSRPSSPTVNVTGVYVWPPQIALNQVDQELPTIRQSEEPLAPTVQYDPSSQVLLIVRTVFSGGKTIADEVDGYLRFSAGSVRLVAGRPDDAAPFKDYYPVATLDDSVLGATTSATESGATSITTDAASAAGIRARFGASGTFKLTGPAAAGESPATQVISFSAVNPTSGVITCAPTSSAAVGGSVIQPTDDVAVHCRIDDFLFAPMDPSRTIDFVFVMDKDHLVGGDANKFTFPAGTFMEVKRYGQVDLTGKILESGPPPANPDKQSVARKPGIEAGIAKLESVPVSSAAVTGGTATTEPATRP